MHIPIQIFCGSGDGGNRSGIDLLEAVAAISEGGVTGWSSCVSSVGAYLNIRGFRAGRIGTTPLLRKDLTNHLWGIKFR
jgi:hypothetical protein